jgi:hypothetical protein
VLDPLKLNAIIERSRQGQRVFVKERHLHGEGMADLANAYFHTSRIPIRFLNNVTAWQLWELKCFNMLNGDRFRAIASGRRKVILDKLPGKSLWCYLKQGRTTLPAVKAATREFHRAHQMYSAEFGDNWSHGDATATNVIYDQKTDRARLIDFEIMHEPSQPAVERHADDLFVFLLDVLANVSERQWLPLALGFLEAYGDADVIRAVKKKSVLSGGLAWIWWEVRTNFTKPSIVQKRLESLRRAIGPSRRCRFADTRAPRFDHLSAGKSRNVRASYATPADSSSLARFDSRKARDGRRSPAPTNILKQVGVLMKTKLIAAAVVLSTAFLWPRSGVVDIRSRA